ncbi:MAG: hypothetical protein ACSLEM_05195 [Candidatus Malihini olakiniferum]
MNKNFLYTSVADAFWYSGKNVIHYDVRSATTYAMQHTISAMILPGIQGYLNMERFIFNMNGRLTQRSNLIWARYLIQREVKIACDCQEKRGRFMGKPHR